MAPSPADLPARRSSTPMVVALVLALAGVVAIYVAGWSASDWRPLPLALVIVAAIAVPVIRESEFRVGGMVISGSIVPFYVAVAVLGPMPAAVGFAGAMLYVDLVRRRPAGVVISNVLNGALTPLLAATLLVGLQSLLGAEMGEVTFGLALIGAGLVADLVSCVVAAALTALETPDRPWRRGSKQALSVAQVTFGGLVLAAAVVWIYARGGAGPAVVVLVALSGLGELLRRIDQIENELRAERDQNARYLDIARSMFLILDRAGRITLINRRGTEILGQPEEQLLGQDWFALTAPAGERAARRRDFERALAGAGATGSSESVLTLRDGREVTVTWNTTVLNDAGGGPSGLLISGEDVTERRRAEAQVAHLAYHDELTGLANRSTLEDRLPALLNALGPEEEVVVFFLDLDGFKGVNDTLGHAAGDELLRQIAERLRGLTRSQDLVVRQGGDEFLLITRMQARERARGIAAVRQRIASAFAGPFVLEAGCVTSSASVGVAAYPSDASNAEELLRVADDAMYAMKRATKIPA